MSDVHIVVPTLGQRPDLLDIALGSLVAQTHQVRITVVAGGSAQVTDDRWVEYGVEMIAQQGRGLSAAINEAWHHDGWSSTFTGWLGDDDALPPWSIEEAVRVLHRRPGASMVHGQCLIIDEHGRPRHAIRNGWLAGRLCGYGRNLIAQPGCLFRTSLVRLVGGLEESCKYAMDVDLYLRLKEIGYIATSHRQLGVFREHAGGLSTSDRSGAAEEARSLLRARQVTWGERALDRLAEPVTRALARGTPHLPPHASHYWRPATREHSADPRTG